MKSSGAGVKTYLGPVGYATVLHSIILLVFLYNWESKAQQVVAAPPKIVKAALVAEDPIEARRKKAQAEKQKRQAQTRKKKQAEAERKRREAERKKKQAADKRKAEQKRKAEAKRKQQAAEREKAQREAEQRKQQALKRQQLLEQQQREQEFLEALDDEDEFLQGEEDTQAVNSYMQVIQHRIVQNWSRPASARLGMQAVLSIHLVPTGEVNNVYVSQSSGDAAFDQSALQAVHKAGRFEELQQLSPRVFDANFRRFKLTFRPEDLDR